VTKLTLRKELSAPGLFKTARKSFESIDDPVSRRSNLTLADCLMSGLAIFSLKYPSLLQFDRAQSETEVAHNLKSLYHIQKVPSDTYLRERLDEVSPELLRQAFKAIFSQFQRGKELEAYSYIDGHYLLSIDGTGFFSSSEVHCNNCCVKNHRDGRTTYYHQMLGAVLVHPDISAVIPFPPEPILKQDGAKKNDCERNAAKRLLPALRREHPHLKLVVIEDALASNGPHIKQLQTLDMRFILGVKPKGNVALFDWAAGATMQTHEKRDDSGSTHKFEWINDAPLNDTCEDVRVNFLKYWEIKPNGKQQHFSWVTDLLLTEKTVYKIMRGGRARWKIENETFNTLKNQGYHFEHNFGHGYKHLSTTFAYLMMLAFLIDNVQAVSCQLFKKAQIKAISKVRFWEKFRHLFFGYLIDSWDDFYSVMAYGKQPTQLVADDTS